MSLDQLLSNNATFTMGDFYVSILIFRHTFFMKRPCIPALFLIHESKLEENHRKILNILSQHFKFPVKPRIACVTDSEKGTVNAVQSVPQLIDIRCWNHVFNDLKAFVAKTGGKKEEAKEYRDDKKLIWQGETDKDSSITQNQSESINFVMHHLLKWKEVPVDALLLAVYHVLPNLTVTES